jgi:hypothetical protein
MNPQTIKTLLSCAEGAENQNAVFDPFVAFSLRWIAWESLRIRMLAVAARLRGCRIKDTYRLLGKCRISSNKIFADYLECISGVKWKGALNGDSQKGWNAFKRIELVRHRLFHGYKTVDPRLIHAASGFLSKAVPQNHMIFGSIEITHKNGIKNRLGNALDRYPAAGKKIPPIMDIYELSKIMGGDLTEKGSKKLPSIKECQKWDTFLTCKS